MGERRPPVRIRKQDQVVAVVLNPDLRFILLGPYPDFGAVFLTQLEVFGNVLEGSAYCSMYYYIVKISQHSPNSSCGTSRTLHGV